MKGSRSNSQSKEKTMKRVLLVVGAAVLFLSAFVTPGVARFDGGNGGTTGCGGTLCKP